MRHAGAPGPARSHSPPRRRLVTSRADPPAAGAGRAQARRSSSAGRSNAQAGARPTPSAAHTQPPAVPMWWGRRPAGPALSPPPRPSPASCRLGPPPAARWAWGRRWPRLRPCGPARRDDAACPSPHRPRFPPHPAPNVANAVPSRGPRRSCSPAAVRDRHAPRRRACRWAASPTRTDPNRGPGVVRPSRGEDGPHPTASPEQPEDHRAEPIRSRLPAARWRPPRTRRRTGAAPNWRPGRVLLASASWLLWPVLQTRTGALRALLGVFLGVRRPVSQICTEAYMVESVGSRRVITTSTN